VTRSADGTDDELIASWNLILDGVAVTQQRIVAKIEKAGLPGQWFEVLRLLLGAEEHRMAMSALARELAMTAGGFTKLADRMARNGLIDRRNSAGDRRVVYATLTPEGLRRAQSSMLLYQAGLRDHILGVLSAAKLAELTSAIRMLREAAGDQAADDRRAGDHTAGGEGDAADDPSTTDPIERLTERDPALPDRRRRGRLPQ
jgi:DNA-binding MarR family transcriptional regulator